MVRKTRLQKWAAVLLMLSVLISCIGGFSASAATTKEITLTTNSDINPFLRVPLYSRTFSSGGPFTVRCEMKIDSFTRTKSDGNIFVNIADGRDSSQMVVWMNTWTRKTNDWIEMTDSNGQYITFNNIDKVLISGALEDFGLIQFGVYYGDAVVHYRNFRILNAAGNVVYSWDNDPALEVGNDVRDLSTNTLYGETFGDGSAEYIIEESETGENEPDPTTTTPVTPTTTTAPPADEPDDTDPVPPQGQDTTTATEPDETEPSEGDETTTPSSSGTTASSPTEADPVTGPTTSDPPSQSGGLGAGAIAGIVIGVIVVLAGGTFGVLYALKKLPWMKKDGDEPTDGPDGK